MVFLFQWRRSEGVSLLTVAAFSATGLVRHGFTARTGGVSEPPYHTLNMGFTVNDDPLHVLENRRRVATALGVPLTRMVAAKQVHGDRVALIKAGDEGRGALTYDDALEDTDALVSAERGILLSTYHADCIPVSVLDPVTPAIGLAHAGWKGTALKIAGKAVAKMSSCFGTRPEDCLVAIGPGIGPCCYEVDQRVKEVFHRQFAGSSEFFRPVAGGHWHLDLWAANVRALKEAGVKEEHIFVSSMCTCCNTDTFFSHRKEGGRTGRMASLMMLK